MSFGQARPIVNGTPAKPHEYPFAVYLTMQTQANWHAVCGGTLISPRHIVTAAHCLHHSPREVRVGFGHSNTRAQKSAHTPTYHIHPRFDPRTLANDIAVVELGERLEQTPYVHRLPIHFGTLDVGTAVVSMGWGVTQMGSHTVQKMNKVELHIADPLKCREVDPELDSSLVCTTTEGGRDECNGDSGSPTIVLVRHKGGVEMRLVALTSFGDNRAHDERPLCGDPSGFGFNTRVGFYEAFLRNVTGMSRAQMEEPVRLDRSGVMRSAAGVCAVDVWLVLAVTLLALVNSRW
ncbi:hypothetical protein GGI25_003882 [Coemansia spiralis]|uniref:Peptidase S1 domain-containing protein n=2 Tax=Coemansia TaxID=4863 RepID=A0A9W8KX42_9FUNG|nr:trypsin-like cysteine/serine peptidase domain-containing protein [Coemansia spiralis]KAJ1991071.1 hypothetical protein EDC05_003672 [Coemansia umbellata]KAJ2675684.1 hypothetical protein GGI25_003882 [Coemansia spiralis]